MGRKKTIVKLSEKYIVNEVTEAPFFYWQYSRLSYFANIATLSLLTLYFLGSLNMVDKMCTFIISGKLIGTSYALTFSNVCWISVGIVATLLAKSTYSYFKIAKNRNKIKLQIKEATPLSLSIRITV